MDTELEKVKNNNKKIKSNFSCAKWNLSLHSFSSIAGEIETVDKFAVSLTTKTLFFCCCDSYPSHAALCYLVRPFDFKARMLIARL